MIKMDFVKRENQNVVDEESYRAYTEALQKTHQMDPGDLQHTSISMEQFHQAMQSSFATNTFPNLAIPFSPRQMSSLMLKTNNLSRNIHINEIPAHLPRNLSEIELAQTLVNETIQQNLNLSRSLHDDLARNINESFLQRNFDLDLSQHNLNLDQNDLSRSDLSQNLVKNDLNQLLQQINSQNVGQELNLTQQLSRNPEELRRMINGQNSMLDVNRGSHGVLMNGNIRANQSGFPLPSNVKIETEEEYFYDNVTQNYVGDPSGIQGHVEIPIENNGNMHQQQDTQIFTTYNNQNNMSLPSLNSVDIYSRPYMQLPQNYHSSAVIKENPEDLVIHRQYDNQSPYPNHELKKTNQNGAGENGAKINNGVETNENSKPLNKINYDNTDSNNSYGSSQNEKITDDTQMPSPINIKGEYVCYKCNEVFPSKRGLKQHTKNCHEASNSNLEVDKVSKYLCTQCSYRCQSPAILKIHERTHSGEKPFSCTFCSYKSGQKNNVAKHILVHMKEKPFRCQYCSYRCAQKNNLVVHERTHTGFKPFACTYCDYRTVQKPNLVKHLYLHTDQKPFSCDLCSYRCVQKTNLTKHKQRHINESNSEKVDYQKKPYRPRQKSLKCPQCPYKCVQKSSLDKHVSFKHPELYAQMIESDFGQENFDHGLNLMKNDSESIDADGIQNLSVKKDSVYHSDPLSSDKVMLSVSEPL